jgi:uncharacterized protein DUF5946
MTPCPDCGAPVAGDTTCRALFEQLLAHEYAFPKAFGAVHHLTVAAYSLQHPRGYSRDAIRMWRVMVDESLDGVSTPEDFLIRARMQFGGGVRVREPGSEPPEGWPHEWPVTVADVVVPENETGDAEGHIARVRRWAGSIRTTLDEAVPM